MPGRNFKMIVKHAYLGVYLPRMCQEITLCGLYKYLLYTEQYTPIPSICSPRQFFYFYTHTRFYVTIKSRDTRENTCYLSILICIYLLPVP